MDFSELKDKAGDLFEKAQDFKDSPKGQEMIGKAKEVISKKEVKEKLGAFGDKAEDLLDILKKH